MNTLLLPATSVCHNSIVVKHRIFFVGSDRYHATMNIHFVYCVSLHAENMECAVVYTVNNGVRIN